jgi:small nuclear ribonucleoprotein (snRNP)-like protein
VVTRHRSGVRGVATGFLTAFDRHMNLIMRDVHEEYTVLVMGKTEKMVRRGGGVGKGVERSRWGL